MDHEVVDGKLVLKEDDILLHFDRRIHIPLSLFDIKVQLDCKRSVKELNEELRGKEC